MLIAHEWVEAVGGSEDVFRELLSVYPNADAACLWADPAVTMDRPMAKSLLASRRVRRNKALALPLMPIAWRAVDISGYDTVLTSSHAFAHHLSGRAARAGLRSFSYVHTPARYIWAPEIEQRGQSLVARLGSIPLRHIDRRAVDARTHYAANSQFIRERIQQAWGIDAEVIYPGVGVSQIQSVSSWADSLTGDERQILEALPTDGFVLGASRLVTYKRLDRVLAVGAATGRPVVIAGAGPDESRLRELAVASPVPVTFLGRVSNEQLFALYEMASLFVFLATEDFGIMPVEAIAAGTPVLASTIGGARESVERCGGGQLVVPTAGPSELAAAADSAMRTTMDDAKESVKLFSREAFRNNILDWIERGVT